jgi:hypothetical protein
VQRDDRADHQQEAEHRRQAGGDRQDRRYQQRAGGLRQHGLRVRHRQRFPEQHAAVLALVVQRAEAVEEDHERQHDERPARCHQQADVDAVAEVVQLPGIHVAGEFAQVEAVDGQPVAVDLEAVVGLPRHDLADHDRHDREQQRDAAGDQRRPQETALVLPELASQQQLELVGGMRRHAQLRGRFGVDHGVHA